MGEEDAASFADAESLVDWEAEVVGVVPSSWDWIVAVADVVVVVAWVIYQNWNAEVEEGCNPAAVDVDCQVQDRQDHSGHQEIVPVLEVGGIVFGNGRDRGRNQMRWAPSSP